VASWDTFELAQQEIVEALAGALGVDLTVLYAGRPLGPQVGFLRWIQGNTN
jgi:hypothetical protein